MKFRYKKNSLELFLLWMGVALFPLYLLPSGSPQISHFFLILLSIVWIYRNGLSISVIKQIIPLAILLFIITIRQSIYSITINDFFLTPALFYIYNFIILIVIIDICNREKDRALDILKTGIFIGLLVTYIGIFYKGFSFKIEGDSDFRAIGFFNNPNQLGYYAICVAGLFSILFVTNTINLFTFSLGLLLCIILVFISLSKAAIISIFFYIPFIIKKLNTSMLLISILVLICIFYGIHDKDFSGYKLIARLGTTGHQNDDSLYGRGYATLFDPDIRLIYGWGEGFVLTTSFKGEVHSTLGNILISYGIIGFSIFCWFLVRLIKLLYINNGFLIAFSLISPVFLYGLVHNGFRFSIYWVFTGALISILCRKQKIKF